MNVAYIILAHKNPQQVIRLVLRLLDGEGDTVVIHYDRNSADIGYRQLVEALASRQNVLFTNRTRCSWGGFAIVEATVNCLRELSRKGISYDYAMLLSGQDYPLQCTRKLKNWLKSANGHSFMQYFSLPNACWHGGGVSRLESWQYTRIALFGYSVGHGGLVNLVNKTMNMLFPRRKFFPHLTPYGGSQWWCLSREAVGYILHYIQRQVMFVRYFRSVHCSDEIFFHTILMNSPLRAKVQNESATFADWTSGPDYPKILGSDDYPRLIDSPCFFARKFDMERDAAILAMLDAHINSAVVPIGE